MTQLFKAVRGVIDRVLPLASAVLFTAATLCTAFSAVVRTTGIQLSVVWVEELVRYSMIWACMLIISIGFRKGTHTQFTLFEEKLKGVPRHLLRIIINILELVMFGMLLLGGIKLCVTNAGMYTSVMMISMAIPYASIPFGAAMVLLEVLMMLAEEIQMLGKPDAGDPQITEG